MIHREAYGAFAWAYDQALGGPFLATVTPLLQRLFEAYPSPVKTHLDLACGTGLALQYLEREGFRSVGVDASLAMLGIARMRARSVVAGDLRALPLRGIFARITCLYDSLNHLLHRRELIEAFRSVHRLMDAGSLFIFDMNRPEIYREVWQTHEPFVSSGADHLLTIHTSYSRWRRMGHGRVSGWARVNGKRYVIDEVRRQRAYARDEIESALSAASLRPIEVIDFDPFPPDAGFSADAAKWLFVVRSAGVPPAVVERPARGPMP